MSSRKLTVLVAAFGDPGHVFPALALSRALKGRGHEVVVETWEHWREAVEADGLRFIGAEGYQVFPPPRPGGGHGATAADAAEALVPTLEELRPDVVVSDILTLAPSLAAELTGSRLVTLVPHVYPVHEAGMPFFSFGWMPPRTPIGAAAWKAALPLLEHGLRIGRDDMNASRARLGLPARERFHGGISDELVLVATLPQLEYPREWPAHVRVCGPMTFELPHEDIDLPRGRFAARTDRAEHVAGSRLQIGQRGAGGPGG